MIKKRFNFLKRVKKKELLKFLAIFLLIYTIFQLTSRFYFNIFFHPYGIAIDMFFQLSIAYIAFRITKNNLSFTIFYLLIFLLLNLSNTLKIAFYGDPVYIDDIFLISEVFSILNGLQLTLLTLFVLSIVVATLLSIDIKKLVAIDVVIFYFILFLPLFFFYDKITTFANERYHYIAWDQKHNYAKMGSVVYLYQAYARYKNNMIVPPSKLVVKKARNNLTKKNPRQNSGKFEKRNVYVIVLESLWDAKVLKNANLSRDPFIESFRVLLEEGKDNYAVSPVFAGKTANAEFEILCGQPATYAEGVVFSTSIHNKVECLPGLLSQAGYSTIAWHPNKSTFFNRMNTYKRIGFTNSMFEDTFSSVDYNEELLSDEALFKTVIEYNKQLNIPHLTYIMTITGHWPYPLAHSRPKIIKSTSKVEEIENYVNSIYYSSKEVMQFLKYIKSDDPNAIIIITGDHLPFLGKNFAGYEESHILKKSLSKFNSDMVLKAHSTPLLIIDGKKGKLDVGIVSMYEIPHIILKLLNYDKKTIFDLFNTDLNGTIRTLRGQSLVIKNNTDPKKCFQNSTDVECMKINDWIENTQIISRDLFLGDQYSLQISDKEEVNWENYGK